MLTLRKLNIIIITVKNRKEKYIMVITKDSIIGDVLDFNNETSQFFIEIGMHCLGCPCSRGETIEQACQVHGTDCDALVKKLNDFLGN